jgi:hypothetical protein
MHLLLQLLVVSMNNYLVTSYSYDTYIYIFVYINIHIMYIYIYTCILTYHVRKGKQLVELKYDKYIHTYTYGHITICIQIPYVIMDHISRSFIFF